MTAPELANLLALQDLDTHIDQQRHLRSHLPERAQLAEVEAELEKVRSARSELAVTLEEVAGRQAMAERELKAAEERIAQVSSRLYGGTVSATRELQAMAADVEGLKNRASALEDTALGVMEEREPLDAQMAGFDQEIARLGERGEEVQARLRVAEAAVDDQLRELEGSRPGFAAAVPAELLSAYERLRGRLGGVAVARLVGGRCDGCHLSLPAVELDRIRHQPAAKVEYCEQCGRILVVGD
jgi:predicted  nucleic acid-binding Zn-ribbon protein